MAMDEKMNKATIMLVIGIMLVGVNATIVTSTFDGLISEGMADNVAAAYAQDELIDDDWNESTSEKVYFGYNLTDIDALSSEDPSNAYTKVGPWIYNVTSHKELLDWNEVEGTMTYSEYEVFEWCGDCTWEDRDGTMGDIGKIYDSVPGTNDFQNVNILWMAESIGAIGPVGFEYGEPFAKAGFATNMMELELSSKAPSIWSAEDISNKLYGAEAATPSYVMTEAYAVWNASAGAGMMEPDFTSSANMILEDAVDPSTGMCIALTCDYGPMLVAGMGEPNEVVTPTRAMLYGYSDISEPERTHIDWAVYALAGSTFLANGGGADLTTTDNNRERLLEVSGVNIANPAVLEYLLFGINEDGLAEGIIQETDFNGLPLNGNILFLLGAQGDAFSTMSTYGIGLTQLLGLADWAGAWIGMLGIPAEFPMILTGSSGTMNANDWWIASFGGEEPLAGGYIPLGLNMGPWEGQIDMSSEDVRNVLYDSPYALASTGFGAEFMYGEATGKTLPQGADGAEVGGTVSDWNDEYVANLYGITVLEAQSVRNYIANFMVDVVVPTLLTFQTGASAYTTQTVDQWLFGSCDPVLEFQFGSVACYSSLETNKTYYGSVSEEFPNGISTGDYSAYVMSIEGDTIGQRLMQGYANTDGDGLCDFDYSASGVYLGEDIECTEGQVYGMTEYLTWRAPAKDAANYGLMEEAVGSSVDYAVLENSIGAIGTADESFKYNLGGYAVAMTEVGDNVEFKGIPMVEHSIVLDATQHNIQSKLIPTSLSPISVTPGVLGLYFNGNVDFKVEPNTNAVMYGHGTLQFVLDIRGLGYDSPDLSEGATDAYPVFEIAIHSEIGDEDAEDVRGATDSIGIMGFTSLDAPMPILALNLVQLVVYVLGLGMLAYGGMNMSSKNEDE
ncbi:MAG: hypothetical protein ISR09_01835 [Candidatus Thalassarchaeum sp.]|nr:hypothetical protein [Candidatus Thalassarchaeum sp.]